MRHVNELTSTITVPIISKVDVIVRIKDILLKTVIILNVSWHYRQAVIFPKLNSMRMSAGWRDRDIKDAFLKAVIN